MGFNQNEVKLRRKRRDDEIESLNKQIKFYQKYQDSTYKKRNVVQYSYAVGKILYLKKCLKELENTVIL